MKNNKKSLFPLNWNPPQDWLKFTTIDAHTEGEPLRIILDGYQELPGETILEKRRYAKEHYDDLRKALMWEPRGHADMYGCIIIPPITPQADLGVLFLHNEGYSTMCGHGIIAVTKVVLETGMFAKQAPQTCLNIDTPAGLVHTCAKIEAGKVRRVYFHNVPSFVFLLDQTVQVPGIGWVKFDIAFCGAFYAFVDADELGIEMIPENFRLLIEKGMDIKWAVMQNFPIEHPFQPDLNFLYGTIFTGKALGKKADSRNVCIFADGEVDRSPTGTGVSARMALHFTRGEIGLNQPMVIESLIGSTFTGSVVEETVFGSYRAVIPRVEGTAFITGKNGFFIDPEDPLKNGFLLR